MKAETISQVGLPFSSEDQELLLMPERVRALRQFAKDIRDYYGGPYLLTELGDRLRIREGKDEKAVTLDVLDRASQPPEIMQVTWSDEEGTTRAFCRAAFDEKNQAIFWTTFGRRRLVPGDLRWLDRLLVAPIRPESRETMHDIGARIMDSFFFSVSTTRQDFLQLYRREQGNWLSFPDPSLLFQLAHRQFRDHIINEDRFNRVGGYRRWIKKEEACDLMRSCLVQPRWIPWSGEALVGRVSAVSFSKDSS